MRNTPPFNLLTDPWLPVRTASGARRRIRPAQIVEDLGGDPAVAPDWPRPDLDIATYELLIGLLALAAPPKTHEDWVDAWRAAPSVGALDAAFAPLAHAFALDGEGPRFLQEQGLEGEAAPIELLLIDGAGENTARKNADVLVHRRRFPALCSGAAAIALYALQAFAPSGGAGNRTSMRGGGPMTTLVLPDEEAGRPPLLWRRVWVHVPLGAPPDAGTLPRILPWLAPTLTSEGGGAGKIHGEGTDPRAHPLQAFFGMPRRLRLVFEPGSGVCALTGEPLEFAAVGVIQRPWGVDYGLWRHPLTPYRLEKIDGPPYSAKPKPGRLGPGDWVAAAVGRRNGLRETARAIRVARSERGDHIGRGARLLLAGWAMNNMEALSFLLVETPLHLAATVEAEETLEAFADDAAVASDLARGALRRALASATGEDAPDRGLFEAARAGFFDRIEDTFHRLLAELARAGEGLDARDRGVREDWRRALEGASLVTFDQHAPLTLHDPARSQRIVAARAGLRGTLRGWGKSGEALFRTLDLTPPAKRTKELA